MYLTKSETVQKIEETFASVNVKPLVSIKSLIDENNRHIKNPRSSKRLYPLLPFTFKDKENRYGYVVADVELFAQKLIDIMRSSIGGR